MEKLDPQLLEFLQCEEKSVGDDQRISVIIQFAETPSEAQIAELVRMGIETRSVAGNITTATVSKSHLRNLTLLESVKYIEGPGTLTME